MSVDAPASAGRAPVAGLLAACAAGVLWGTGAVVVHLLVAQHGFTPASISFWRFAIGALVLLLVFGWRIDWARALALSFPLVLAGTAMAGYVLCWFLGIERIGPAVPTLIALCLPPMLVTGVAVLRGRERLDRPLLAVLAAAIGGTALVVVPHGGPGHGIPVDDVADDAVAASVGGRHPAERGAAASAEVEREHQVLRLGGLLQRLHGDPRLNGGRALHRIDGPAQALAQFPVHVLRGRCHGLLSDPAG